MDCMTALYAGVVGSSLAEKSKNLCVSHSFIILLISIYRQDGPPIGNPLSPLAEICMQKSEK